jgi:hypothetical protein
MKEGRYTVLAESKSEEKKSMWTCSALHRLWGRGVARVSSGACKHPRPQM